MQDAAYIELMVDRVEQELALPEGRTPYPVLVLVSGLPGTGKSSITRALAQRLPFAVLETDAVRKKLYQSPSYSSSESRLVYEVCHRLIGRLLRRGVRVIFDATNLGERHREFIYRIADDAGARLVIARTVAPEEVVRDRLAARRQESDGEDKSDADWSVYLKMRDSQEPIRRPHLVVDTSLSMELGLRKILRAIGGRS